MCLGWTIGLLMIISITFLVAQATEMTNLFTNTTLVLTCQTSEPISVLVVTAFITSVLSCALRIISSMFLWLSCIFILILVGFLPQLEGFAFILRLTGWYLCVLMSQEITSDCLWVTCNLLHMFCSCLSTFHLLGKLPHCTGWTFA